MYKSKHFFFANDIAYAVLKVSAKWRGVTNRKKVKYVFDLFLCSREIGFPFFLCERWETGAPLCLSR